MAEIPQEDRIRIISVTSPGFGTASTNSGFFADFGPDAAKSRRSQQQIYDQINNKLKTITSVRAFCFQAQSIRKRSSWRLPVQYVYFQAATLDNWKAIIPAFLEETHKDPRLFFSISI